MIAKLWIWLIKKQPLIYAPLTPYLLFGGLWFGIQYFSADKVTLQDAVPIGQEFSVTPKAYAGAEPLMINGKQYGWIDASFECWKLAGDNALLVYHKPTGTIKRVQFDFNPEQLKQKSK